MDGDERSLIAGMNAVPQSMAARLVYADWLEEHDREEEAKFLRLVRMTGDEFQKSIVGQKDDEDYSESGWVALKVERNGRLYGMLTSYGHCSCYDTWASICGGGVSDYYAGDEVKEPSFDWIGSWDGLVELARSEVNPYKGTPVDEERDSGKWLRETYQQVLQSNI